MILVVWRFRGPVYNDSRGLLNLKYLCSLLDVPYEGVKARMFRLNESIDQALHHFLSKEGGKND
ncbi:hypothetical protein FCY64_23910 [Escherichia coli]|nr:hypothetical protein [Escherichia coli]MDN1838382.1 hypothetical protein [Escherichia coli]MDN2308638.1 hypothetical protein [Escherichia coli]MDN2320204.1 hypothetical protein [Escherichia coli]